MDSLLVSNHGKMRGTAQAGVQSFAQTSFVQIKQSETKVVRGKARSPQAEWSAEAELPAWTLQQIIYSFIYLLIN